MEIYKKYKKQINTSTLIFLTAIPIFYMLSWVFWLHEIPNSDYWNHFLRNFFSSSNFFENFISVLESKSNEHVVLISNFIYYINYLITGGNNKGLFLINIFIQASSFIILIKLFNIQKPVNIKSYIYIPLLSLFLFSPSAAHNWICSMSGVAWFSANLLFVLCLFFIIKTINNGKLKYFILSIISALLSLLSYSTGIMSFAILICFFICLSFIDKKYINKAFITSVISIIIIILWSLYYEKPAHHPSFSFSSVQIYKFTLLFLGNAFSSEPSFANIMGVIGLILYFILMITIIVLLLNKRDHCFSQAILPWFFISSYALLNALAAAVARSGFGINAALHDRYTNITLLFWIGILISFHVSLHRLLKKEFIQNITKIIAAILIIIFFIKPMYIVGQERILKSKNLYTVKQELAGLALQMNVVDIPMIKKIAPWWNEYYLESTQIRKLMISQNHVPFRNLPVPAYSYHRIFSNSTKRTIIGYFDVAEPIDSSKYDKEKNIKSIRMSGWAYDVTERNRIEYILITNQDNLLCGAALYGYERNDVAKSFGDHTKYSGWEGYVQIQENDTILYGYALMSNGKYARLENEYIIK